MANERTPAMADTLTAAEILASAADLVEFSGRWVSSTPLSDRAICALFAMTEAAGVGRGPLHTLAAGKSALDALRLEIGGGSIPRWNDAQRDPVVVATALRNAKRWLPSDEARA